MKIPAVVNFAPEKGSVEIREIAVPAFGDDDILLEVANVGVCGSDLHQWTADHSWPVNYPVVLGHEFGGSIAAMGNRVNGWSIGDRVVSETAAVIRWKNTWSFWTGPDAKCGRTSGERFLGRLPQSWTAWGSTARVGHVVGSVATMTDAAERVGRHWFRGKTRCATVFG
jgi:NADPH:quinone reductase-like Zn-dependent oxidoreductase